MVSFFALRVYAQGTDRLIGYVNNISMFNNSYPQEKVYLHMDNRSYYIGDTIWFKAYVMEATTLHPTQLSGVLYVELLNEYGAKVDYKKLKLQNGMCHGEFPLRKDYRTGYYEIRAYTRYMLNFGNDLSKISYAPRSCSDLEGPSHVELYPKGDVRAMEHYFRYSSVNYEDRTLSKEDRIRMRSQVAPEPNFCVFSRVFPVYSHPMVLGEYKKEMEIYPMHSKLAYPKETEPELRPDSLTLKFYPEGGNLVAMTQCRIAFEAVDQWGHRQNICGYVSNADGEKILDFGTHNRGRGTFELTPQYGGRYTAHVTFKRKDYVFSLPEVDSVGYTLQLFPSVQKQDSVVFIVESSPNNIDEPIGWTLQCRGALSTFDTLRMVSGGNSRVCIHSEKIGVGVNQLTLFNVNGRVLADRLFFVSPRNTAKLYIPNIPDSVAPHEEVTLNFQTQSSSDWPIQGLFSLSVVDADEYDTDTYDNGDICSELLLSSDLKGFIDDVDSYFHNPSDSAMAADLDLLMLVQGWRRYEWCEMAGLDPFEYRYTPEKGLGIDGYVISEDVARRGNLLSPHTYDRIPDLELNVTLKSNSINIDKTTDVDSLANYSVVFDKVFYGEVPMSITLQDPSGIRYRKGFRRYGRLRNSQIIINRAFSPKPSPYSYYQQTAPSYDMLKENMTMEWNAERTISEVMVKKRFKQKSEVYYERPELTIDYMKEWNFILDRGTPWGNGMLEIGPYRDPEYNMNFPSLTYSIHNLGTLKRDLACATVKDDSVYVQYRREKVRHAYIMPKTIKLYSNLLAREEVDFDPQTIHRPFYYLVVEHYKRSESPVHAPYLSKHGIRHTYYEGYSRVREFYSPDYSECVLPDSADYRRTLYWEPDVWTDHLGRASVTFYNNAHTKRLHVRAEGFTRNGEFIVYDSNKQ